MDSKQLIEAIAANMEAGQCLFDAYEAVLGKGSYDKMLEALNHAFVAGRDKIMINEVMEDICVK
jgi:hypothetical protein